MSMMYAKYVYNNVDEINFGKAKDALENCPSQAEVLGDD
jgi:hypothetical protein